MTVHVTDSEGTPINNASVTTPPIWPSFRSGYGGQSFFRQITNSTSYYTDFVKTDSDGNATLWLFPDGGFNNNYYYFSSTSPSGNISNTVYSSTGGDGTIINITLPYISNNPPTVNPISNTTVNDGDAYTANGSFTDPDSTSWTATVNYGDNSGTQNLPLNPDNTFSLSHSYSTQGAYTVTVSVTDNQGATGTVTGSVTVVIPPPTTLTPTADSYLNYYEQNQNEGGSPVLRLEQSMKARDLVKFDESAIETAVSVDPNYTAILVFTIIDNGNNWDSGKQVELDRMFQDWSEGNGYVNGNPNPDRGTDSGVTWKCASDSNISNNTKDCTSSNTWDMTNAENYPFSSSPTATTIITNHESGTVSLDVTADIKNFLNGTNQNYGWILKRTNESTTGNVDFGSKENGNGPVLIITPQ